MNADKLEFGKDDVFNLTELAEEIAVRLSGLASKEHDRVQGDLAARYPDPRHHRYLADVVTLNASINSLALLVAIAISAQKGGSPAPHLDRVMETLHRTVHELIGSDGGKSIFIKMPGSRS